LQTASYCQDSVFNLFFEAKPFAPILIAPGTPWDDSCYMIWLLMHLQGLAIYGPRTCRP